VCILTFVGPSNSVNGCKNSLLSDDLLQRIYDIMFDNLFTDQYRFYYYEPSDNEYDNTLEPNMIVNVDGDVNDEIIPPVLEFEDASGSNFIVYNDQTLSYRHMPGGLI
jgi:hypothetical protein